MHNITDKDDLVATIEKLYAVFNKYPLRSWISGNTKQRASKIHALRAVTLDDLFENDIDHYYLDSETFRGLFPRICEMIAFEDLHDFELGYNLRLSVLSEKHSWEDWPSEEQDAINTYLMALWKYLPSVKTPDFEHFVEVASDINCVVSDLTPYIRVLQDRCSNVLGVRYLAACVIEGSFGKRLSQQSFVLPLLEKTYYEHIDTPIGEEMARAVNAIEK